MIGGEIGGVLGGAVGGLGGAAAGTLAEPVGGTIAGGIGGGVEGADLGAAAGSLIGSAIEDYIVCAAEHTKNARPSKEEDHELGLARKKRDQGGEKGDSSRDLPRKRPGEWKGPWPPKPQNDS